MPIPAYTSDLSGSSFSFRVYQIRSHKRWHLLLRYDWGRASFKTDQQPNLVRSRGDSQLDEVLFIYDEWLSESADIVITSWPRRSTKIDLWTYLVNFVHSFHSITILPALLSQYVMLVEVLLYWDYHRDARPRVDIMRRSEPSSDQ